MSMDFQRKVVLVTGASRGIGAAIARGFAARGAAVVVNYLSRHSEAETVVRDCAAAGGEAQAIPADVTQPEACAGLVEATLQAYGRLDVLVHNAFAPYRFDPEQRPSLDSLSWDAHRAQFDGAVGAAFHLMRSALPALRERIPSAVVFVASDLVEDPVATYPDYVTAKAALLGYMRQLAAELGPQGIRVNAVGPGLVHPTAGSAATRASVRERLMEVTPLRRLARPEDVAGPVVFLASEAAAFITGQTLWVNGGRVMR